MPYANPQSPEAQESRRRASRKFYAANRESEVARARSWTASNKARVNALSVARRQAKPVAHVLWWNARNRAKAAGIEFSLTMEDIVVPVACPVLGLPLVVGTGHARANSPSLDRVDPAKGYVPGNVRVVSHKANTIKSNATAAELRAVLRYMEDCNGQ